MLLISSLLFYQKTPQNNRVIYRAGRPFGDSLDVFRSHFVPKIFFLNFCQLENTLESSRGQFFVQRHDCCDIFCSGFLSEFYVTTLLRNKIKAEFSA